MILDYNSSTHEIVASFRYDPNKIEKIKRIKTAKYYPKNKCWYLEFSIEVFDELISAFPDAKVSYELDREVRMAKGKSEMVVKTIQIPREEFEVILSVARKREQDVESYILSLIEHAIEAEKNSCVSEKHNSNNDEAANSATEDEDGYEVVFE
ncbi:hypothetical protein [Desulforamulus putei]|uniref:hypothetical protein n=1 Tax=Desulforamulus putei TaxID=74701 RepID=UPI002FDCEACF